MSSLERILPFLRPIEDLLTDPSVTEVMVNGGGRRVFVERRGVLEAVADRALEVRNLTVAIKNIARACGDEISDHQPMLDARLEDGSRVAAMFPPCSVDGPTLTVRKFTHRYTLEELVAVGTLACDLAAQLRAAVDDRKNILISGGTGTGKTTLLNALAATIHDRDRIVLIEETSEILIEKPNLVRFEARRAQVPLGQETPLPAVTNTPRLRGRHGLRDQSRQKTPLLPRGLRRTTHLGQGRAVLSPIGRLQLARHVYSSEKRPPFARSGSTVAGGVGAVTAASKGGRAGLGLNYPRNSAASVSGSGASVCAAPSPRSGGCVRASR